MNHNLKYGLLLGLINVVLYLALLLIDFHLLVSPWISFLILVIDIIVLFVAGYELRNKQGGYLTFKEAFVSTLLVFAIAGAVSVVYNILIYNVIAPDVADTLHTEIVDQTASMMENIGAEDEVIDQTVTEMEANNTYSVGNQIKGFFYSLIFGVIIALIIGAIIKKRKPAFE